MNNQPKVKSLCPPGRPPRYEDVPFADVTLKNGESHTLMMDIYQDLNQKTPGPCIIYYFGGGWMWGEYKQVTQKAVYCRELIRLVEAGYTIVSPSYRLVSQAPFPACIHDCKAVVRFLKAHAGEYNIDPDRIGIFGNSAGGHLAAMVALSAGNEEIEGDVGGNLAYSSEVKAAVVCYAPNNIAKLVYDEAWEQKEKQLSGTEVENVGKPSDTPWLRALGYPEPDKFYENFKKVFESENKENSDYQYLELAKKCTPMTYASPNNPPIMILHGGQDPLVPIEESESLYKALVEAGAEALYISNSRAGHGPTMGDEADQMAYHFLMNRLK